MAILSAVSLATDMYPVDAAVGGLFDELVKIAVVHDPGEPVAENGRYPPTQNGDIRSLFRLFSLMAL